MCGNTHRTAHLLHTTYSFLHLPSQQNSDPRTKPDHNYFCTLHHSNAPSLLLSLSNQPFQVPQTLVIILLAMPTNYANQPMADQAGQLEITIKVASFPSCASPKRLTNVAYLQFVTEPVWAQNPDSQPTNVYPSHTQSRAPQALVFGMISQGPQPDFKIVSISIIPCQSLGVCYRAQPCGQTQEWLRDRGTSTCALHKSLPPVNTLAWLGLASYDHSFTTPTEGIHIKKGKTSFDTSRGKKQHLTAQPRCLVDRALHRSAKHAASTSRSATAPVATATIHCSLPACLSCASKQYILARG